MRGVIQAARIPARKRSTSDRSVAAWLLSCSADDKTWLAADPVLPVSRLTAAILLDTWLVPWAACCTLRAISVVAEPCCSTAIEMAEANDYFYALNGQGVVMANANPKVEGRNL
jgi:hypothetical protein